MVRDTKTFQKFLNGKIVFATAEYGFYFGPLIRGFFTTEAQAIKSLGMTKKEIEQQKNFQNHFEILKIDCGQFLKQIIKQEIDQALFAAKEEIKAAGEKGIYNQGYREGREQTKSQVEQALKTFLDELPFTIDVD